MDSRLIVCDHDISKTLNLKKIKFKTQVKYRLEIPRQGFGLSRLTISNPLLSLKTTVMIVKIPSSLK